MSRRRPFWVHPPDPGPHSRNRLRLRSRTLSRPGLAALIALATLVAAAPFLPRGADTGETGGTARRTSDTPVEVATGSAAATRLTPAMRREIDRVVAEGLAAPTLSGRLTPEAAVARAVRCARFEGLSYCLHVGWTHEPPDRVQADVTADVRSAQAQWARQPAASEATGDLDPLAQVTAAARLTPRARAAQERAELTAAARSVAKVWTIKHEVEGVPYPRGFWERHASARPAGLDLTAYAARAGGSASGTASARAPRKTIKDYPRKDTVLDPRRVREQVRSYWCGPSSTQMIVWGWTDQKRTQRHWARRLGTTTSGTAITSIVDVINRDTGWDRADRAGPYITLDVKGYTYGKWYLLLARHIHDYRAPLVLHPILVKKYFPYLDDDASGHFQVGRGYFTRRDGVRMVSYFEPWNQRRFDPSEPFIERVQWQKAYRSYRANLAHPFHNIGV